MADTVTGLALADGACLCLIDEAPPTQPVHGWELVRQLAPEGSLGRIWSLSRALTYRSLERLAADGFIVRDDTADARRRHLRTTPRGRDAALLWLDTTVEHVRDLRTTFLVIIELRRRRGLAVAEFAARQRDVLTPAFTALANPVHPHDNADPVGRWRHHSTRAAHSFLTELATQQW